MQHRKRNEVYEEAQGMDLPQGFADDGSPHKVKVEPRQRRAGKPKLKPAETVSTGNSCWMATFSLLMIGVLVASYFLVMEHEKSQIEHARQNFVHEQVEPLSKDWELKYAKLEEENERMRAHEKEYTKIKTENANALEKEGKQEHRIESLKKKVKYYKEYQTEIHQRIKLMSHTLALEKFGEGPHRVEIIVAFVEGFPKQSDTAENQQRIVIELAPVEDMPHVTYWFLEQVTRGLYNGCSFHRNAGHVVQGGPAPNFLSPPNPKLWKRFKDAGFHSILFQEYSPTFPHEKYTLGLAGRPGGPDFYVSTQNNTRLHGPGGQDSYDDPSEADPCFAKVIEGFEVVDRMQLGPVKPGGYKAFKDNVAIVSMKLLKQDGDSQ